MNLAEIVYKYSMNEFLEIILLGLLLPQGYKAFKLGITDNYTFEAMVARMILF